MYYSRVIYARNILLSYYSSIIYYDNLYSSY